MSHWNFPPIFVLLKVICKRSSLRDFFGAVFKHCALLTTQLIKAQFTLQRKLFKQMQSQRQHVNKPEDPWSKVNNRNAELPSQFSAQLLIHETLTMLLHLSFRKRHSLSTNYLSRLKHAFRNTRAFVLLPKILRLVMDGGLFCSFSFQLQ